MKIYNYNFNVLLSKIKLHRKILLLCIVGVGVVSFLTVFTARYYQNNTRSTNPTLVQQQKKLSQLQKQASENPEDYSAQNEYAYALYVTGNRQEAIQTYSTVLELNPTDTRALLNLGHLYRSQKQYEKAIESYTKVLETDETELNAQINLVHLYLERNEKEAAYEVLETLLRIHSTKPHLRIMAAKLYKAQGDYELAKQEYLKIIELDPSNATARAEHDALSEQ